MNLLSKFKLRVHSPVSLRTSLKVDLSSENKMDQDGYG